MEHTSALSFKDSRLRSQAPTHASTFACTSDQFLTCWRSGPNHTTKKKIGPLHQRQWSIQSNALDGSKLLSAASVLTLILSRISHANSRLFWIDLLFTLWLYSVPIRSPATIRKLFARTQAIISNSVFCRVVGLWSTSSSHTCLSPFFQKCDPTVGDSFNNGFLGEPIFEYIHQN